MFLILFGVIFCCLREGSERRSTGVYGREDGRRQLGEGQMATVNVSLFDVCGARPRPTHKGIQPTHLELLREPINYRDTHHVLILGPLKRKS